MARVNIEDELFRDSRFLWLSDMVGGSAKALGLLVQFWLAAQRRWGKGELLQPEEFPSHWKPLMEVGFAKHQPNGIYAAGAEERFAWYRAACEASRKGVEARTDRSTKGVNQKVNPGDDLLNNLPIPTPTPILKEEEEEEEEKPAKVDPVAELIASIPAPIQATWESVWGVKLVQTEFPKAAAWWITNPDKRQLGDTFPRFANAWFQREKEANERHPPPSASKAKEKPPPPKLIESLNPVTGELRVAIDPHQPQFVRG